MSDDEGWASLRDFRGRTTRTAADVALLKLVDVLRSSVYGIGDRLPSIAELTESLGVSRDNVRRALRRLESAKVVEVTRGRTGGVTVIGLARVPEALAELYPSLQPAELRMLVEAWSLLEREVLVLASSRAGAADIAILRAKVSRLHDDPSPSLDFMERTIHFHVAAASMSANDFLRALYSDILNQLSVSFARQGFKRAFTQERMIQTLGHYDELLASVAGKDLDRLDRVVHERRRLQEVMLFGDLAPVRTGEHQ